MVIYKTYTRTVKRVNFPSRSLLAIVLDVLTLLYSSKPREVHGVRFDVPLLTAHQLEHFRAKVAKNRLWQHRIVWIPSLRSREKIPKVVVG